MIDAYAIEACQDHLSIGAPAPAQGLCCLFRSFHCSTIQIPSILPHICQEVDEEKKKPFASSDDTDSDPSQPVFESPAATRALCAPHAPEALHGR